jgi:hypothetical protein
MLAVARHRQAARGFSWFAKAFGKAKAKAAVAQDETAKRVFRVFPAADSPPDDGAAAATTETQSGEVPLISLDTLQPYDMRLALFFPPAPAARSGSSQPQVLTAEEAAAAKAADAAASDPQAAASAASAASAADTRTAEQQHMALVTAQAESELGAMAPALLRRSLARTLRSFPALAGRAAVGNADGGSGGGGGGGGAKDNDGGGGGGGGKGAVQATARIASLSYGGGHGDGGAGDGGEEGGSGGVEFSVLRSMQPLLPPSVTAGAAVSSHAAAAAGAAAAAAADADADADDNSSSSSSSSSASAPDAVTAGRERRAARGAFGAARSSLSVSGAHAADFDAEPAFGEGTAMAVGSVDSKHLLSGETAPLRVQVLDLTY